jgi:uncharacterized protein
MSVARTRLGEVGAHVAEHGRPSVPVRVAITLVRAYQGAASGRVSPCRFYPSCSNYAVEAFTVHGFWRGLSLSARRLLRCRPLGPHGVDLVPVRAGQTTPTHVEAHQHGDVLAPAKGHSC